MQPLTRHQGALIPGLLAYVGILIEVKTYNSMRMEQMSMRGLDVISIDYEDPAFPTPIRDFRPAVYMDGNSFCCLLGPDPQAGIFGCGTTQQAAISDLVEHFHERIDHPAAEDELAKEIIDSRSISKKDVW
jgi:hypothetical protein